MARRRGFTLVELLVVFAIMGGILALLPAAYGKLQEATEYRAAISDVTAALRTARLNARREGHATAFFLDSRSGRFGVDGEELGQLPKTLEVGMTLAAREREDTVGRIRFYPDGSSTGGSIRLSRKSGGSGVVRVDWLFGRISQHRGDGD